MDRWEVIRNPNYAGIQPSLLGDACHDGSAFVTIRCSCGTDMHLHESQLLALDGRGLATGCQGCQWLMTFEPGTLEGIFAAMRDEGWIK